MHRLSEADRAELKEIGFRLPVSPCEDTCVKVIQLTSAQHSSSSYDSSDSEGPPPLEPIPGLSIERSDSTEPGELEPSLSEDIQLDSVTQIIGWDPNGQDPLRSPQINLEEMSMEDYLLERNAVSSCQHLLNLGVECPGDLCFLFVEDLVEFGIPLDEARRIMLGIHPSGTLRSDNPNMCALRTGEVQFVR